MISLLFNIHSVNFYVFNYLCSNLFRSMSKSNMIRCQCHKVDFILVNQLLQNKNRAGGVRSVRDRSRRQSNLSRVTRHSLRNVTNLSLIEVCVPRASRGERAQYARKRCGRIRWVCLRSQRHVTAVNCAAAFAALLHGHVLTTYQCNPVSAEAPIAHSASCAAGAATASAGPLR